MKKQIGKTIYTLLKDMNQYSLIRYEKGKYRTTKKILFGYKLFNNDDDAELYANAIIEKEQKNAI